jgi:hypothetical protein
MPSEQLLRDSLFAPHIDGGRIVIGIPLIALRRMVPFAMSRLFYLQPNR